jgi:hypothetical protein
MGRCLAAGHVSAKEWSSTVIRLILKPQTRQPLVTTVDMLIMHIVTMHKSHNASAFQNPDVVPN